MKIETDVVIRFTRATKHPLRIAILLRVREIQITSPKQLSEYFDESLGVVSYHVGELRDLGVVTFVKSEPRRGAAEHFYSISDYGRTVLQCAVYITRTVKAMEKTKVEADAKVEAAD